MSSTRNSVVRRALAWLLCAGVLGAACSSERSRPTVLTQPSAHEGAKPASAESAPGLVVHKDPVTGEFIAPPPGAAPLTTSTAARVSALTQTASPGGGFMIELDDRFHNQMSATRDDTGTLHSGCTQESAR